LFEICGYSNKAVRIILLKIFGSKWRVLPLIIRKFRYLLIENPFNSRIVPGKTLSKNLID